MKALRACGILAIAILGGCATPKPPEPGADQYMVSALHTPFYRYGPAQGIGADSVLENGTHLTLLYKSFGYSRVMLENGISGYVSTDSITLLPAAQQKPVPAAPKPKRAGSSSRASTPPEMPPAQIDLPLGLPELPADPSPAFRY